MESIQTAIAIAQSDPKIRIALISKVYLMRSHTGAAESRIAAKSRGPR